METIYHYDQTTGESLYHSKADPSPLEEDVLLIPAYATPKPVPEAGPKESALYLDESGAVPADHEKGNWFVKEDWRGVPLWDTTTGHPVSIAAIGQTPSEIGATDEPCPGDEYVWDGKAWAHDDAKAAAMASATRKAEIIDRLSAIDTASIRPLRAVLSGRATDMDKGCLSALEEEADKLRKELTAI